MKAKLLSLLAWAPIILVAVGVIMILFQSLLDHPVAVVGFIVFIWLCWGINHLASRES